MSDRHVAGNQHEMLPLYLLGAHAAGDFPLQTDHMAAHKFDSAFVRAKHVTVYSLPFVGATALSGWSTKQRVSFLLGNWLTHFAIDTRRWKEPVEGFEAFPVWYDQALHVVAIAVVVALTGLLTGDILPAVNGGASHAVGFRPTTQP